MRADPVAVRPIAGLLKRHRQVERFWTGDVVAGAVVQLTDRPVDDWPQPYRRECLDPAGISVQEEETQARRYRERVGDTLLPARPAGRRGSRPFRG